MPPSNGTTPPGNKTVRWRLSLTLLPLAFAACTAVVAHPVPRHVNVPPGHMPPPGSCRIWFPDRPPGQQPPPGPCEVLRYQVPWGAHLIYG